MLKQNENLTGAIITPGIVYGYGETCLFKLFKKIYNDELKKAPIYYGGNNRIIPFVNALDLALLIHALVVEKMPDKE